MTPTKSSKRGRKKDGGCNDRCRFCSCSFENSGTRASLENLFSKSARKESPGTVLADCCSSMGFPLIKSPSVSERVCNLTFCKENWRAGPSVIQHCRKTLHSRTKENRLITQIQKALWRKLEPLFSRNKKLYASKEVKENTLASNPADQKTITTVNRYVCHDLSVWNMRLKSH